jgi:hypothetical protein
MWSYFRGWKRKISVVTLILSLAMIGLWLRSQRVVDWIDFGFANRQYMLTSFNGRIGWKCFFYEFPKFRWQSSVVYKHQAKAFTAELNRHALETQIYSDVTLGTFSHLYIVIPLTLISAWCLLTKPRAKATTQPESAHA